MSAQPVDVLAAMVPATFWDDHRDRCPSDDGDHGIAREVSRKGRRVRIEGTPAQIECLRKDAAYYADADSMDECPRHLRASAKRTISALACAAHARIGGAP